MATQIGIFDNYQNFTVYWLLGESKGYDEVYAEDKKHAAELVNKKHNNRVMITDIV